ncbi:MAG: haloacid dehalogenase [Fimbriimonas ginsengisoli]|uniref:Haloacid dehalogenase n=1 Tax=Fimbriimonas ginsengisoli TaxID=1005039 RepID=A0A931PU47_FIMGI|nr:haloacid dehalogenase [Fimbriimonas ginsengisoli]MBI3744163.1 haloacid dehalogenase [Chloroflexota bacterium]
MKGWEAIAADLRKRAQAMHEAREAGLVRCRELIQLSARCIRHVHRHQWKEADALLTQARGVASQARSALGPYPELLHAGYLHDAEKEMVEASAVIAIVRGEDIPTPETLGVDPMSYLNGMGEAASEVRRYALDEMRRGNLEAAEAILAQMEAIYDELITFDYADSMTGGLRRTCDALRAVVERTRSDLTATASQHELVQELRSVRSRLGDS